MPAAAIPTVDDMFSVRRADRCVQDASAHNYIRWIKGFRFYVDCLGLEERAELTQEGACRFAEWYGRHRRVDHKKMARAQTALHALNRVYEVMGLHPPKWSAPRPPVRPASALLQEYADYLARHRGSPPVTVQKRLTHVGRLLEHLSSPRFAFDRAASYIRDRMIPSSNSLMLPFIPSSRRSFGWHGS